MAAEWADFSMNSMVREYATNAAAQGLEPCLATKKDGIGRPFFVARRQWIKAKRLRLACAYHSE
jgi:hypothetical protein